MSFQVVHAAELDLAGHAIKLPEAVIESYLSHGGGWEYRGRLLLDGGRDVRTGADRTRNFSLDDFFSLRGEVRGSYRSWWSHSFVTSTGTIMFFMNDVILMLVEDDITLMTLADSMRNGHHHRTL